MVKWMGEILCWAHSDLFKIKYEYFPDEWKEVIEKQNGLPCDYKGIPGLYCLQGCYWHTIWQWHEDEFQ